MELSSRRWLRTLAATSLTVFVLTLGASQVAAVERKGALKPKEVKALVVNAKTAADHMKLARHFTAMADKHEAEANEHEALAAEYTRNPQVGASKHAMAGNTAEHCKYYAEHCRKAAKEMRAMAAGHEAMAKDAGK